MRKPWNRPHLPVYSVSSHYGNDYNMHICTYVTAVSMEPKMMLTALYHGTKTIDLVSKQKQFVLQLLNQHQVSYVRLLGKQSGFKRDKIKWLRDRDLLIPFNGYFIFRECAAAMLIDVKDTITSGDHTCFIGLVKQHQNINPDDILTTEQLRLHGIIR
ncbi:MAG: flavin reductase [Bacteroidota bacterium]|jgi:flavin reductase (DIM6/NTAB) family NADH-FMN oxidoreductase RutF|nr:flavin reductase family protein [Bacteroidota bacterium]GDX48791.1 hypothetical protein LBMAG25_16090 [Bacteroidota bacterium]